MVTEEALAERKAALEGDPGTDSAVKISMPQDAPMHSAQRPSAVQRPVQAMESGVSSSAVLLLRDRHVAPHRTACSLLLAGVIGAHILFVLTLAVLAVIS